MFLICMPPHLTPFSRGSSPHRRSPLMLSPSCSLCTAAITGRGAAGSTAKRRTPSSASTMRPGAGGGAEVWAGAGAGVAGGGWISTDAGAGEGEGRQARRQGKGRLSALLDSPCRFHHGRLPLAHRPTGVFILKPCWLNAPTSRLLTAPACRRIIATERLTNSRACPLPAPPPPTMILGIPLLPSLLLILKQ